MAIAAFDCQSGRPLLAQAGRFAIGRERSNLAFSQDEKRLVVLGRLPHINTPMIRFIDTGSWKSGHAEKPKVAATIELSSVPDYRSRIALSPDGKTVAVAWVDYRRSIPVGLGVWTPAKKKSIPLWIGQANSSAVQALAFPGDGGTVALAAQDVPLSFWSVATGKRIELLPFAITGASQLAYSSDGRLLAVVDELQPDGRPTLSVPFKDRVKAVLTYRIRVVNLRTRRVQNDFRGHHDIVTALAFSPDNKVLASGSADTTVLFWDIGHKAAQSVGHSK